MTTISLDAMLDAGVDPTAVPPNQYAFFDEVEGTRVPTTRRDVRQGAIAVSENSVLNLPTLPAGPYSGGRTGTRGQRRRGMITSDPKIVGIMLSDSVIVEQGTGKLSLLNCFSGFNAERFPFVTPHFFISVFVTNLEGKPDEINMTVRIESPRNGHVYASASITMRPTSPDSEPLVRTDVLSLPFRIQASLPNAGIYNACVLLNNQPVDQRSFRVNARTETRGVIEGEQKT